MIKVKFKRLKPSFFNVSKRWIYNGLGRLDEFSGDDLISIKHKLVSLLSIKDNTVVNSIDYNKDLDNLKDFVVRVKTMEEELYNLRNSARSESDKFIKKYSNIKHEIGNIISWLNDTYSEDEIISILGDSIKNSKSPNKIELNKLIIKDRLENGFKKPELYSDMRVERLTSTLNNYNDYIKDFDSIEIDNDSNCLDRDNYIISRSLQNILLEGSNYSLHNRFIDNSEGVYLVVFRIINNKDGNVLVYKYIRYMELFLYTLLYYVTVENNSLIYHDRKNVGVDYIFNIDKSLVPENINKRLYNNSVNLYYSNDDGYPRKGIYPRNILDLYKIMTTGYPLITDNHGIAEYIFSCIEKRIYDIALQKIYNLDEQLRERYYLDRLKVFFDKSKLEQFNLLSKSVFLVKDLNGLINIIKSKYNINQGVQKWRGQSDSCGNTIAVIDNDYRKSLNRHNQFHVNQGVIPANWLLGRSKFSYQNIHLNLGNVRWYSSNTKYDKVYKVNKNIKGNNDIYIQLSNFLENNPINESTQLKIEKALYESSYISLKEKLDKSNNLIINYNLINHKLSKLLITEKSNLLDYINKSRDLSFKKEPLRINNLVKYFLKKILIVLDDDYVISVIYGRLFKILSINNITPDANKAVDIFVDIGNDIIKKYIYTLYTESLKELSESEKIYYKLNNWKIDNIDLINKLNKIQVELGGHIITWLKNLDLLWVKLDVKNLREKHNLLVPTDRIINILDNDNNKLKPLPKRLPMIVKPKPYKRYIVNGKTKEELGGYLLNDVMYTDNLMIPKWNFKELSKVQDNNLIYNLVNNISSVGYKINKEVFDFITTFGLKYSLILDSNHKHPLMLKEKLSRLEYVELSSYLSKIQLQESILGIAEVYLNIPEIYFPVRIDFTGRLYCIADGLSYQSNELAKSLLLFSKSEKIFKNDTTSLLYFKAYGANCFGNKLEKKSWKERINWVDNNTDNIIKFRNGELLGKADKKLLFIAFCFEYNRYLDSLNNESEYFETNLPIQLDATCNGYQHLSLLSLDHNLAKELNLTKSTWDDEPKDFYNYTGVRLITYFKDKLTNNSCSSRDTFERLSSLTIARKILKRAIMTIPYNVSHTRIIEYLQEYFIYCDDDRNVDYKDKLCYFKDDTSIKLKNSDFPILAKGLKTVLGDDRFKINKLLSYLNNLARACAKAGVVITWTTPLSGILINQSYMALNEERLKLFSYTKKTFSIKVPDKSNLNKSRQIRAFMPNLIHTLDAASLAILVDYYYNDNSSNIKNIFTIHDCFAVTANNVEIIVAYLKLVYNRIYSDKKYLIELDKEVKHNIKLIYRDKFDEENLIIYADKTKIKFPSLKDVLDVNSTSKNLISYSSYIAH